MSKIPVYIVNLKHRYQRRRDVLLEFQGKEEFEPIVINAIEESNGALGLWKTIKFIITEYAVKCDADYIIFCEDDHKFTCDYSYDHLLNCIESAGNLDAEILSGGVSYFSNGLQVTKNLSWVEIFSGLQFTVIFKSFFNRILDIEFGEMDSADTLISTNALNKFIMYPYISIQKDYGYSDVTTRNNRLGRVEELFDRSAAKAKAINYLSNYWTNYTKLNSFRKSAKDFESSSFQMPCNVILLHGNQYNAAGIKLNFLGKDEFELNLYEPLGDSDIHTNVCLIIQQIVSNAINENIDSIIITFDNHRFSDEYSKEFFFRNLIDARHQNCEILAGRMGDFDIAICVGQDKFWINKLIKPSFFVLYRESYSKIVNSTFEVNETFDHWLSRILVNKMCLFPFISNVYEAESENFFKPIEGTIEEQEQRTVSRLDIARKTYEKYYLCV